MGNDSTRVKIKEIFELGSNFRIDSLNDINKGILHIFNLIQDAYLLLGKKSYGTAAFLAITILEEVAKITIGKHIKNSSKNPKNDPLRNHKTKHIVGAKYTLSISNKLIRAIGQDGMDKIVNYAQSGELIRLREGSLYCDFEGGKFSTPEDNMDLMLAVSLLLFAIESFDDNLIGLTQYSHELSDRTDEIIYSVVKISKINQVDNSV